MGERAGDGVTPCRHPELVLGRTRARRKCRRCGLTITVEELGGGPCPECHEARGENCRDFEDVAGDDSADCGYRCAECGARIGWE